MNKPQFLNMFDRIRVIAPEVVAPSSVEDLPTSQFMVYILSYNGNCLVCGHGKKNRAQVIFDDRNHATDSHIKSICVRIYHMHAGPGDFERFIIPCQDKKGAAQLEKQLHQAIGGNSTTLPEALYGSVVDGLDELPRMALRMGLCSAFSGLRDLKKWRLEGILDDHSWYAIQERIGKW